MDGETSTKIVGTGTRYGQLKQELLKMQPCRLYANLFNYILI